MGKVTNNEIFDNALFQTEIEKAKKLVIVLDEVEKGFVDVAKAQQQIVNKEDNKTIQSVQRTKKAIQELTDVERAHIKVQKQKKSLSDQLRIAQSKQGKDNIEHKNAQTLGRDKWYSSFRTRISKVERDYGI